MPTNRFQIRFERSGGLAGLSLKATVDSDRLPADDAAHLEALLDRVDPHAPSAPPRGADRFQYDIQVERDGKTETITCFDGSMSPELKALTDRLMGFARSA